MSNISACNIPGRMRQAYNSPHHNWVRVCAEGESLRSATGLLKTGANLARSMAYDPVSWVMGSQSTNKFNHELYMRHLETLPTFEDEDLTDLKWDFLNFRLKNIPNSGFANSFDVRTAIGNAFVFNFGLFVLESMTMKLFDAPFGLVGKSRGKIRAFWVSAVVILAVMVPIRKMLSRLDRSLTAYLCQGENAPKSLSEVGRRVRAEFVKAWNSAVATDKSFHPAVEGMIVATIVLMTWNPLIRMGLGMYIVLYTALNVSLVMKSGIDNRTSPQLVAKQVAFVCVKGIIQGLMVDLLKFRCYGCLPEATISRAFREALLKFSAESAIGILTPKLSKPFNDVWNARMVVADTKKQN